MLKLQTNFHITSIKQSFVEEVVRQLFTFLTELLSKHQSGFRPKHPTLPALIQMCVDWLSNMDNGEASPIFSVTVANFE